MNHEARIKKLETQIAELSQLVKSLKKDKKWLTLQEVSQQLGISPTVIRNRILNGTLKHGYDWKRNGNRYLVNLDSVGKKIL
jgi:predicted transcriptional regulator of viral defense system